VVVIAEAGKWDNGGLCVRGGEGGGLQRVKARGKKRPAGRAMVGTKKETASAFGEFTHLVARGKNYVPYVKQCFGVPNPNQVEIERRKTK
jgi:hypothetical protein